MNEICLSCRKHTKCGRAEHETIGCGYYVPMTNEEYIHSLNTEQFAEWLRGVYWHCHEIDCEHCNYPWRCMEKGDIVVWLKQPHREE